MTSVSIKDYAIVHVSYFTVLCAVLITLSMTPSGEVSADEVNLSFRSMIYL